MTTHEVRGATAAEGTTPRLAVEAAERAFSQWSAMAPSERGSLLQRASELLMVRQAAIAALVTEETNGTLGWGMFNVQLGTGMLAYYAKHADATAEEQEIPSHIPGKRAKAVRQPVGVVVGIAPWNAPVILGVRAVAAPLAYGNTVVLKASEQCPRTHAAVVDALTDAGVPVGAINLVTNDPSDAAEVVEELIAHPAVRRVSFTGSTRVGRIVAETAGRHLKRVLLELGGKAPLVVLADADLERAVAAANFGAFMHQGQICMSTERIVIDRTVADEFAHKLAERAGSLKVGDPREQDTQIGPLVNADAVERVTGHVEDAVARGAKVISGGRAHGLYFEPTVVTNVSPGNTGSRRRYSAATSTPPCPSPGDYIRACATSTTRLSTTNHRCRSEASRTAGGAASAATRHSRSSPSSAGSPFKTAHASTRSSFGSMRLG